MFFLFFYERVKWGEATYNLERAKKKANSS